MLHLKIFCILIFVTSTFHNVSARKDIMYRCANKDCTENIRIGIVQADHKLNNGFTVKKQTKVVLLAEPISKKKGAHAIVRTVDSNVIGVLPYTIITRQGKSAKNIKWTNYTEEELLLKVPSSVKAYNGSFEFNKRDEIQDTVIESDEPDNTSKESADFDRQSDYVKEKSSSSNVQNDKLLEDGEDTYIETEDSIPSDYSAGISNIDYLVENTTDNIKDELRAENDNVYVNEKNLEKNSSWVEKQTNDSENQIESNTTVEKEPTDGTLTQNVVETINDTGQTEYWTGDEKDNTVVTDNKNENGPIVEEELINAHLLDVEEADNDIAANEENRLKDQTYDLSNQNESEVTKKESTNAPPSQYVTDNETLPNLKNLSSGARDTTSASVITSKDETTAEEKLNAGNMVQYGVRIYHDNWPAMRNLLSNVEYPICDKNYQTQSTNTVEELSMGGQLSQRNDNDAVPNLENSMSEIKNSIQDLGNQSEIEVAGDLSPISQPLLNENDNEIVPNAENSLTDEKISIQNTTNQSDGEHSSPISQLFSLNENDNDVILDMGNSLGVEKEAVLTTDFKNVNEKPVKNESIQINVMDYSTEIGSDTRPNIEYPLRDVKDALSVTDTNDIVGTVEKVSLDANLDKHEIEIDNHIVPNVEKLFSDVKHPMYYTNYQINSEAVVQKESANTNLVQNFVELDNVAELNIMNSLGDLKDSTLDPDNKGVNEAIMEHKSTDASYVQQVTKSDNVKDKLNSPGVFQNSEKTTSQGFEDVEASVFIDAQFREEDQANELVEDGIWNGFIRGINGISSYISFNTASAESESSASYINEFLAMFSHWWNYIFKTSNSIGYELSDTTAVCRKENFTDALEKRKMSCNDKMTNHWTNRNSLNFNEFERVMSSNMFLLLLCTSITVLFFCFGYYYLERRKSDAVYVMKINELERELLIASKEVLIMEKKLNGKQERLQSENDDVIRTSKVGQLQEENKKLMERTIYLEKELETISSSAIEMHRLLELSLATQSDQDTSLEGFNSLQVEFDDLSEKHDALKKSFEALVMDNQFLKKDYENMKVTVEKIITENKILVKRNLEYMEKNRKYEEEINKHDEKLLAANSEYKKEVLLLKMKIDELELSIRKYSHENKQLKRILNGKKENDEPLFDKTQLKIQLSTTQAVNNDLSKELKEEKNARQLLEDHVENLTQEVNKLRKIQEIAEREKVEAVTKLKVLSGYFKEKEEQFRKELENMQIIQNEYMNKDKSLSDKLIEIRQQIDKLSEENEQLRKEIKDQEISYKTQLATEEQKSRDHWFSLRQAERKYKESQQEAANLRKKFVLLENSLSNPTEKKSEGKLSNDGFIGSSNGDISSGPSSMLLPPPPLSPDILPFSLRPDFIPPPLPDHSHAFMPPEPLYPIDQRLPPLGGRRVSSPPIPLPLEDDDFLPPSPLYPIPRDRNISSPPPPQFSVAMSSTSRRDKERSRNGRLSDNVGSQTSLESLNKSGR